MVPNYADILAQRDRISSYGQPLRPTVSTLSQFDALIWPYCKINIFVHIVLMNFCMNVVVCLSGKGSNPMPPLFSPGTACHNNPGLGSLE